MWRAFLEGIAGFRFFAEFLQFAVQPFDGFDKLSDLPLLVEHDAIELLKILLQVRDEDFQFGGVGGRRFVGGHDQLERGGRGWSGSWGSVSADFRFDVS